MSGGLELGAGSRGLKGRRPRLVSESGELSVALRPQVRPEEGIPRLAHALVLALAAFGARRRQLPVIDHVGEIFGVATVDPAHQVVVALLVERVLVGRVGLVLTLAGV